MNTAVPARRLGPKRVFAVVFITSFIASLLWAMASPVFSVPDENAHAYRGIALLQGQWVGEPREGERHPVVDVPDGFEFSPSILCYVGNSDVSAACAAPLGAPGGTDWFGNWVATYNPSYYLIVSWPSLILNGEPAVYAMRAVSALVNSLVLGWAAGISIMAGRRPWTIAATSIAVLPVVAYFSGSVNPQGLEIAAAVLLWWGGLRLIARAHALPGASLASAASLWLPVIVGAAFVSNARATGPLWVLVIAALCATVAGWRPTASILSRGSSWPWLAGVALPAFLSVGWTLWGGSLSGQAIEGEAPLVGATALQGAWWMAYYTPVYLQHFAGVFGWLDTSLPWPLYFVLGVCLLVPVIVIVAVGKRVDLFRLGVVCFAAFAVPVAVQSYSVAQTGIIWQGRYGAFLYLGIVIVAAWMLDSRGGDLSLSLARRLPALATVGIGAFSVAAFAITASRYVTGLDAPIFDVILRPEWNPPVPAWVLIVVYLVVMTGYAFWVARESRRALVALVD